MHAFHFITGTDGSGTCHMWVLRVHAPCLYLLGMSCICILYFISGTDTGVAHVGYKRAYALFVFELDGGRVYRRAIWEMEQYGGVSVWDQQYGRGVYGSSSIGGECMGASTWEVQHGRIKPAAASMMSWST